MTERPLRWLSAILALLTLSGLVWLMAADLQVVRADSRPGAAGQQEGQPGRPIIIRWSTESEVNTAGYNIYRAETEGGPWQKINERLIPASPDPLTGGSYVYSDTQVIAGKTYWYELEEVELSGITTKLEQTQATAQGDLLSDLAARLPCASVVWLVPALGAVLVLRRRPGLPVL